MIRSRPPHNGPRLRRRARRRGGGALPGENGPRRPRLQKGFIVLPSAFTLANLFFGVFALVAASRGDYAWAAWFVVIAGVLDALDGRVARVTRTGTNFGAQLDSLVDAISFGVAPAYVAYRLHFAASEWGWLIPLAFIMAIVIRLARFNVEQAGGAKRHFTGLPSPVAGITVAAVYPFSQTALATRYLEALPWPEAVGGLMLVLAVLMVSPVPYSAVPTVGKRAPSRTVLTLGLLAGLAILLAWPEYVIFLALMGYAFWGLAKAVTTGLLDRLPESDVLDEDDDGTGLPEMGYGGFHLGALESDEDPAAEADGPDGGDGRRPLHPRDERREERP